MRELWVAQLGTVPYTEATAIQERVRARREAGELPDTLLVLEHPPVYTRGRRTQPGDLPLPETWYAERGIEVRDADRGGRVTYHGPGQLVVYPIVAIDGVAAFVGALERAIVAALADEGVAAEARAGAETGIWASHGKIASIGVRVKRRVTMHGLAVNVDNDLEPFEWIVPCGIDQARMTSIAAETGRADRLHCFRRSLAHRVAEELELRQRLVSPQRLLERSLALAR